MFPNAFLYEGAPICATAKDEPAVPVQCGRFIDRHQGKQDHRHAEELERRFSALCIRDQLLRRRYLPIHHGWGQEAWSSSVPLLRVCWRRRTLAKTPRLKATYEGHQQPPWNTWNLHASRRSHVLLSWDFRYTWKEEGKVHIPCRVWASFNWGLGWRHPCHSS